jgi:hypothetical protein
MSNNPQIDFRGRLAAAEASITSIDDTTAGHAGRSRGWTRKQILGHLIDSALNNHQRVVRAALDGSYEGPSYDQAGWVAMHGYTELPWHALLNHWREQNNLLARVVERVPEDRWSAPCRVGPEGVVTLAALVESYLAHMEHHVGQITSAQPAS